MGEGVMGGGLNGSGCYGNTPNDMCDCYGKHKYDIKKGPDQNELAAYCHPDHNVSKDLELYIVDYGIYDLEERK